MTEFWVVDKMNADEFLLWEKRSRDTIDFKMVYVDMAGDLIAGLLLSQIIYWYLPDKEGDSKLRVFKDGLYWIAKERSDWWKEIRITAKQYDHAVTILEGLGLVETDHFRFNGLRTNHIRLCIDQFLSRLASTVTPVLPKGELRNSPLGNSAVDVWGRPLTETTTQITAKNTASDKTALLPKEGGASETAETGEVQTIPLHLHRSEEV